MCVAYRFGYIAHEQDFVVPAENFELGTGGTTTHRGEVFNNTELSGSSDYYVFIRAFSSVDEVWKGREGVKEVEREEVGSELTMRFWEGVGRAGHYGALFSVNELVMV
jgi:hypothetical protein